MFDNQSKILLKHKKIKPDLIRFFVSFFQQSNCLIAISEAISSTMTKFEMAKDIHLQLWIVFDIWCGKLYAIWIGQNSIETNLQTYAPAPTS